MKREQLKLLADAYLKFLISRDADGLKSYLSLDFSKRLRVSQQLRLIKNLPTALNYGIGPEAHLWEDYVVEQDQGVLQISPFQFDVSFRSLMNPLITETMTVTLHAVILEETGWKISSILSDPDHHLLINYANQTTPRQQSSATTAMVAPRSIQPKK